MPSRCFWIHSAYRLADQQIRILHTEFQLNNKYFLTCWKRGYKDKYPEGMTQDSVGWVEIISLDCLYSPNSTKWYTNSEPRSQKCRSLIWRRTHSTNKSFISHSVKWVKAESWFNTSISCLHSAKLIVRQGSDNISIFHNIETLISCTAQTSKKVIFSKTMKSWIVKFKMPGVAT